MTINQKEILTKEERAIVDANTAELKRIIDESIKLNTLDGHIAHLKTDMDITQREISDSLAADMERLRKRNEEIIRQAEKRYMDSLGSADNIYADAAALIKQAEKEDFRDFVRQVRTDLCVDDETRAATKEFRQYMNFDFRSARVFLLHLIMPHMRALQELDEKPEGLDFTYVDLLEISVYRKVKDEWGYKEPVEKKPPRAKKETVDVLNYVEENEVYSKRLEDRFIKEIGTAIGENPPLDIQAKKKTIVVSGDGNLEWVFTDAELSTDEMQGLQITSEAYLILDMLLDKLTAKIPQMPQKNKDGTPNAAALKEVLDTLQDENVRTVTLTREDYLEQRHLKENKGRQKRTFENAIMSIGTIRGTIDTNTPYYLFSSPPHEAADMYDKGDIKAVFNYDWTAHLYKDGVKGKGQLVYRPKPLRSVDLKKHPLTVVLWNWLQNNYNYNVGKQNPHSNRVKIGTTIDKIPELRQRDEKESNGNKKYYEKIIKPLQDNLDALDKVYKIIEYEYLDSNKKPMTKTAFNRLKYAQQKECWIRYQFVDYPDWNAPEQLGDKPKS